MRSALYSGLVAGAAGTAALNAFTYLDMALRGRPGSDVPARSAERIAESLGLALGPNRTRAAGALLGYADGLAAGAAYGLLRSALRVPWTVGALGLAAATLAIGEGSATRLGATDWSQWSASQWVEDVLPRLVYGTVTALAMELLAAHKETVELGDPQDSRDVGLHADQGDGSLLAPHSQ